MSTAYSRVTVVNGARRVDLALPNGLPLHDVMPQLLGFCAPEGRPEQPVEWTLGRIGGTDLALTSSLADAGVFDGDVLELRTGAQTARPVQVEDVRDVLEDAVDRSARQWHSDTTVAFALITGSMLLAAAVLLLPLAPAPAALPPLIAAVTVTVALVVAGWWADGRGHTAAAQVAVAVAGLWGGALGWLLSSAVDWPLATGAASALVGVLLVTAAARVLTRTATTQLAAIALLAAAGLAAGGPALAGVDPLVGVKLAATGTVLLAGVLPRVSLTVGGLASADYLVRNQGWLTEPALAARVRASTALLHGGVIGAATVGAASGLLLASLGTTWDQLLGVIVGVALMLRSRVFSRVPQVVPLRVAGLVVLAGHATWWVQQTSTGQQWAVALAAVAAGIMVGLSAIPLSDVARARVKQLLNRAELVVVTLMIPVAAAALGLFELVAGVLPS